MDTGQIHESLTTIPPKPKPGIPKWLNTIYHGMEQDIEDWYFSTYFHQTWSGRLEELDDAIAKARAIAEAKLKTLQQTALLSSKFENTAMRQLAEAKKSNWFRYVGEIENVKELLDIVLQEQIEKSPNGGYRYEVQNLLSIIDTLSKMGIDKDFIIPIPHNISKARMASGPIIEVMKSDKSQDEKLELARDILALVANKDVTAARFSSECFDVLGKTKPETPKPVPATVYLTRAGEMIVIESDPAHTKAIEMSLKGIVTGFYVGDYMNLIKRLGKMTPENTQMLAIIDKGEIKEDPDGIIYLPTPESFADQCINTCATGRMYIEQLLTVSGTATVPIHSLAKNLPETEIETFLQEKFQIKEKTSDYQTTVLTALKKFYYVPQEINYLYRGNFEIKLAYMLEELSICLIIYSI